MAHSFFCVSSGCGGVAQSFTIGWFATTSFFLHLCQSRVHATWIRSDVVDINFALR